jgi:hypothetical protein
MRQFENIAWLCVCAAIVSLPTSHSYNVCDLTRYGGNFIRFQIGWLPMSCVSLWADEISHTQHTPHALSGMYQCALQRALHGNPKSRLRQCPRNTWWQQSLKQLYLHFWTHNGWFHCCRCAFVWFGIDEIFPYSSVRLAKQQIVTLHAFYSR